MPSPFGHFLGGIGAGVAAATLAARARGTHKAQIGQRYGGVRRDATRLRNVLLLGALGTLPDIDFLFGAHSMYTHSVGITAGIGCATLLLTRERQWVAAAAASAAYASHIVLDWLGSDSVPPIGIMALWPFLSGFYQSDLHWFPPIRREYWLDDFVMYTIRTLVFELAVLGPVAALAIWNDKRAAGGRGR